MKKIFAILAVAFIALTSAFAMDLSAIQGTWTDENYNADYTFKADGTITLSVGSEVIYTFDDSNVKDFKISTAGTNVTITFRCDETQRSYMFVKGLSLTTDLTLDIDRDWTDETYNVTIVMKKLF